MMYLFYSISVKVI